MKKISLLFLFIIVLVSLVSLTWYKSGFIIARGDYFPTINVNFNFARFNEFTWLENNLGSSNSPPLVLSLIPYFLSIPFGLTQVLEMTFFILVGGLSVFFLSKRLHSSDLAAFIASLFYILNFFVLETIPGPQLQIYFTMPLVALLTIKLLDENGTIEKITCLFVLSLIFSLGLFNPAAFLMYPLTVFIFILYYVFIEGRKIRISRWIVGLLIFLLLSSWWLLPFSSLIFSNIGNSGTSVYNTVTNPLQWSWTQSRDSFLNLFWFNPTWGWSSDYFSYFSSYNGLIMIAVFLPVILLIIGLILVEKKYLKLNFYLGGAALLLLFLEKGLHSPLSSLNLYLYKYIPYFFIFREPDSKFMFVSMLLISLLIGYGCKKAFDFLVQKRKKIIAYLLVLVVVGSFAVSVFPFFTSGIIMPATKLEDSSYVSIPNYWFNAGNYLNNQNESFSVFIMPEDTFYQIGYNWGFYGSDSLPSQIINHATIQNPSGYTLNPYSQAVILKAYNETYNSSLSSLNYLFLLDSKYILYRNDVNVNVENNASKSLTLLNNQSFFSREDFGNVSLFEVKNYTPHRVYVTSNVIVVDNESDLFRILASVNATNKVFFVRNDIYSLEGENALKAMNSSVKSVNNSNAQPTVSFSKINPTLYKVQLNTSEPTILVFLQAFSPQWNLYDNIGVLPPLTGDKISSQYHFIADGYANAWFVNETGSLTFYINYDNQLYYNAGFLISILSFLAILFLFITKMIKQKQWY